MHDLIFQKGHILYSRVHLWQTPDNTSRSLGFLSYLWPYFQPSISFNENVLHVIPCFRVLIECFYREAIIGANSQRLLIRKSKIATFNDSPNGVAIAARRENCDSELAIWSFTAVSFSYFAFKWLVSATNVFTIGLSAYIYPAICLSKLWPRHSPV